MTLKDYFNMGRDSEKKYASKQRSRQMVRRVAKPGAFSLGGIIMGVGILYQIIASKFQKKPGSPTKVSPTMQVIKGDVKTLVDRIQGSNEDWETYRNFLELAKGKK
jgi:hypothetical protein